VNGQRVLITAFVVAIGIAAWKTVQAGEFPPAPSRFVGPALLFTLLAVVAAFSPNLAAAFGVGVDVAVLITGVGPPTSVNPIGRAVSGTSSGAAPPPVVKGTNAVPQ